MTEYTKYFIKGTIFFVVLIIIIVTTVLVQQYMRGVRGETSQATEFALFQQ